MKRFACIAAVCLVATLGFGVSAVQAQVMPPDDSKMYVELNVGPTLGHKSDKFFGAEGGYRLTSDLDVFVEFSHMGNVATTDLDDRAAIIANSDNIRGTATTAFKVNAGVAGLRYNLTVSPMIHPYVLGGVGIANVKTEVEFNVGGTTIDPATHGVQLGGDLSGTHNKTILVFGFGVRVPFKTQFFADLGYRYGQILAKTDNFETDKAIPTQRVILGVGIRF
jgi:opacity protein-like surface antigen